VVVGNVLGDTEKCRPQRNSIRGPSSPISAAVPTVLFQDMTLTSLFLVELRILEK